MPPFLEITKVPWDTQPFLKYSDLTVIHTSPLCKGEKGGKQLD
jgi:hypothetical protein